MREEEQIPYITRLERDLLDSEIGALASRLKSMRARDDSWNAGLLNYAITSLILRSCELGSYTDLNQAVGVLECVKAEFLRKKLYPYENRKCSENGEVY